MKANLNAQYTFGALPKTYRMYPQILARYSNKMRCIVGWLSEIPKQGGGARFVRLENGHFTSLYKERLSLYNRGMPHTEVVCFNQETEGRLI